MPANIITTDDLREFKLELLEELKNLLSQQNKASNQRIWLKSAEVRKRLKISPGTLQNLRNKKVITGYKIEGIIFYDAAEIDAMILKNKLFEAPGT